MHVTPVPAEIIDKGKYFQLESTNSRNGIIMSVMPEKSGEPGQPPEGDGLEIYFRGVDSNTQSLDSDELELLSLPPDTTTREFMEAFEKIYGKRWEGLDVTRLTSEELFDKLFPEIVETRNGLEARMRLTVLRQQGLTK